MSEDRQIEEAVAKIITLTAAASDLIQSTSDTVNTTLDELMVRRRRSTLMLSALGAVILALLVFVAATAIQNHFVSGQVRDNASRIVECTTPGAACFADTQEQLNERIAFRIQDALGRNQESLDYLLGCVDPQSATLCAKQRDARLAQIIRDAIAAR